jgi:hypothetical protein
MFRLFPCTVRVMQAVHEIKSSECALITLQRGHGGNATFYICIMSMHDTTCTYIGSVKFCKTSTIYGVYTWSFPLLQ